MNAVGGAGVVAFALHVTGHDGRGFAMRALSAGVGWGNAGDGAMALWTLAASSEDPEEALSYLSRLLGFTLEAGHDYLDSNPVSLSFIAGGFLEVPTGPLRHGRLPGLQARAWLDVALSLRAMTSPQADFASEIASMWQARQDSPPRGHLWDPAFYHRLSELVRVSDRDLGRGP